MPYIFRMDSKNKILIVEDIADCRELLVMFLGRLGYEVIEAATGLEGVDRACAALPDLILMDIGLPGINGVEATARLKANPSTKHIPVIINTGFGDCDLTRSAVAAGCAEIVHKPFRFKEMEDFLRKYLSRSPVDETVNSALVASVAA